MDEYLKRFHRLYQFECDDYPERFVQLFDGVPLVDPQVVAAARAKALKFAPAMRELRETFELRDPEPVFSEIDKFRESLTRGQPFGKIK